MIGNGTELEQVVDTHRTSCRSGWPRDFGALNPSPRHSFFVFLVSSRRSRRTGTETLARQAIYSLILVGPPQKVIVLLK